MELRPYQQQLTHDVLHAWQRGARNVLMVSPTGSGKTHTKTHIAQTTGLVTCNIAHRQELVLQISESLASFGITHNIIAPVGVIRFCAQRHAQQFGRVYYDPNAPTAVAGVQTLLRRVDQLRQFINRVQLWDIDEAHHCLPGNQWGKATELFPRAIGLGVTATPLRCDRKGLDGVFDCMVVGPSMRDLINNGHLSEYRIFAPPQSFDTASLRVSQSTGEYVRDDLVRETERSTIVGDVVAHYLRIAPGKRGLTFTVDVKSAGDIADAYNAAGVPASVVSAKTPDKIRTNLLDRLKRGEIKQLCNVDLFGEGMDCPALEVVSAARPTQSYGLYVQQFGRAMRPLEGKTHGIFIDHVGNVIRHGLPDAPRQWSLSAPQGKRAARTDPDAIGLTSCEACFRVYERHRVECPYCGHVPEPSTRSAPEYVDGDLIELDADVLAQLRGDVDRIDGPALIPQGVSNGVAGAIKKRWHDRQQAQSTLREVMAVWSGVWHHGYGETDREIQRRFYLSFGLDMVSAQALGSADAAKLTQHIRDTLT